MREYVFTCDGCEKKLVTADHCHHPPSWFKSTIRFGAIETDRYACSEACVGKASTMGAAMLRTREQP